MAKLLGFVWRSDDGKSLKLGISKEAFDEAETHRTDDGDEYVAMKLQLGKIYQLLDGQKHAIGVHIFEDN